MIDHDVLVIRSLSYGADDTGFGYGKEKRKKKSIDTLGGKKENSSSRGLGFTGTVPTLISSFSLRFAIAPFVFQSTSTYNSQS